jgi:hypothetical protein
METVDKWNRYEIAVNEDMVAFVEVPSISQAAFSRWCPQAIFLDVVLVFQRPGPSLCENPQAAVGHRDAQHPKSYSPRWW